VASKSNRTAIGAGSIDAPLKSMADNATPVAVVEARPTSIQFMATAATATTSETRSSSSNNSNTDSANQSDSVDLPTTKLGWFLQAVKWRSFATIADDPNSGDSANTDDSAATDHTT
jgi:hypothetical protein